MKRYLHYAISAVLGIVLIGCQKEETVPEPTNDGIIFKSYYKDVLMTVSKGSKFETKGLSECKHYTITGELNDAEYSLYLEIDAQDDGLSINRTFCEDGTLLFTQAILDGKLVSVEFTDLDELWGNGTGNGGVVETMGEHRRGEKYKDCVKRVHKDMKEKILKANEFWCDALWFFDCGHFAAVYAIVMCNEYENQK